MTEEEWLTCAAPQAMLEHLRDKATARKLRLFACGQCRQLWSHLSSLRSRRAVEVSESFADGRASQADLKKAWIKAAAFAEGFRKRFRLPAEATGWNSLPETHAVHFVVFASGEPCSHVAIYSDDSTAFVGDHWQRVFLDIFGNPFRPVSLDAEWLTSTVVALATGIYAERAFDRMPILADALQDAGCTNEDVLNHCRDTSLTHVRGCWVVDLVLGKS
jgi:hypothetical protein